LIDVTHETSSENNTVTQSLDTFLIVKIEPLSVSITSLDLSLLESLIRRVIILFEIDLGRSISSFLAI